MNTPPGAPTDAPEDAGPVAGDDAPEAGAPRPTLVERFANRVRIKLPARHNAKLAEIVERVNAHDRTYALWVAANVTAVDRLHMSDHGPVHVQIVANSALRLIRLLMAANVEPNVVSDYGLERADAEVVVTLAALFHDVGMSIHREGHEGFSLFVAQPILDELLAGVYDPPLDTIVRSEIQHAIISHRSGGRPLSVEGGILRIADALDMAQGRSRIPFTAGSTSIHAVSAAAIEGLHIESCETHPVRIRVEMSNSAGVFQVDELLRRKLKGSGLERHVLVEAVIEGETEKRLVQRFRF
jgi:metal-dependent HD superfamily phosphatase/phosphodiesterase